LNLRELAIVLGYDMFARVTDRPISIVRNINTFTNVFSNARFIHWPAKEVNNARFIHWPAKEFINARFIHWPAKEFINARFAHEGKRDNSRGCFRGCFDRAS
jgi:hypothetical protein